MTTENKETSSSPEGSLLGTALGRAVLALLRGAGLLIGLRGDSKETKRIGDLDGGGVYVGKSATDGKDLHAALADEPEYLTYGEAFAAAIEMRKQPGRANAHVPTPEELNVNLYLNKDKGALSGSFNTSGSFPAGCYCSSEPLGNDYARVQWFGDGSQFNVLRDLWLPVRLVW